MGCDKITAPNDVSIDTSKLPGDTNFPNGQSANSFADSQSFGLSNALKGAENLIGQNVKSFTNALNPEAIGQSIGTVLGGIAGTITSAINGAFTGVTGLAGRLSGFGSTTSGDPNSADAIRNSVQSSNSGRQLSNLMQSNRCNDKYVAQAGKVNNNIKTKATTKANQIPNNERRELAASETKSVEKRELMAAEVTAETQEEAVKTAIKQEKETRSVQENIQSDIIDAVCDEDACDRVYLSMLLYQMSFIQTKMHNTLTALKYHTSAIVVDAMFPGRFNISPTVDMWSVVYHGANFEAYARLAKDLKVKWDESCAEYTPASSAKFGTLSDAVTFDYYMQTSRADKYSPNARVSSYHHDGVKLLGPQMLEEYFELWSGSSWMLNGLTTKGVVQSMIDAGLSGGGGLGLLSVPSLYASDSWFQTYTSHIGGGSSHRPNINTELLDYVYNTQQPEVQTRFGLTTNQSSVIVDVTNDASLPTQLYERNFLMEVSVNWSDLTISSIKYLAEDDNTISAINS